MYRLACNEVQHGSHPFQVVEVGSYAGSSAITWALAVKARTERSGQVLCVDPWRNYLTEEDVNSSAVPNVLREMAAALESGQVFALFDHNVHAAGVSHIVRPLRGRLDEVANSIASDSSDIVYIDANHQYAAVINDLKHAARLVRRGGILCGDDLELQWPLVDTGYCEQRTGCDLVVDPKSRQFVHPGVSKAVWDFFGSTVSAWNGFWAMRKTGENSWEQVVLPARFRHSELPPHLKWWRTKINANLPWRPQPQAPPYSNK
jgi:predicted O-methyltransferase YrrM